MIETPKEVLFDEKDSPDYEKITNEKMLRNVEKLYSLLFTSYLQRKGTRNNRITLIGTESGVADDYIYIEFTEMHEIVDAKKIIEFGRLSNAVGIYYIPDENIWRFYFALESPHVFSTEKTGYKRDETIEQTVSAMEIKSKTAMSFKIGKKQRAYLNKILTLYCQHVNRSLTNASVCISDCGSKDGNFVLHITKLNGLFNVMEFVQLYLNDIVDDTFHIHKLMCNPNTNGFEFHVHRNGNKPNKRKRDDTIE